MVTGSIACGDLNAHGSVHPAPLSIRPRGRLTCMRPSPSHVLIIIRFTLALHSITPLNSPFLLGNLATDGEVFGDASGQ
jgi:hypothetical protein